jgi:flagellin
VTIAGPASGAAGSDASGAAGSDASGAITAINNAIAQLGLTQGNIGAGENLLNYASSLATSQITNYSAAQSTIRDANVAADASNLTKSQTLQQTAIAAMAQANSEAQSVLKLLQ